MLSLYDLLRLIGIFAGIGYSFHAGHISEVPTWTAALVAGVVGVGVAWIATAATRRLARANSEALLWCAYVGTVGIVSIGGTAAGIACFGLIAR